MTPKEAEKTLLSKLRTMGFLLLFFALLALSYNFLPSSPEEPLILEEELALDVADIPPLNPYIVALSFTTAGLFCLIFSWKRRKEMNG